MSQLLTYCLSHLFVCNQSSNNTYQKVEDEDLVEPEMPAEDESAKPKGILKGKKKQKAAEKAAAAKAAAEEAAKEEEEEKVLKRPAAKVADVMRPTSVSLFLVLVFVLV